MSAPRLFVPWVKRTDISCCACRRRKVKCKISKERPQDPCERCAKRRLCCQYMSVAEQEDLTSAETTPPPTTPPPTSVSPPSPPRHSTSRRFLINEQDVDGDLQEPTNCARLSFRARGRCGSTSLKSTWTAPWCSEVPSHSEHHFPPYSEFSPSHTSNLQTCDGVLNLDSMFSLAELAAMTMADWELSGPANFTANSDLYWGSDNTYHDPWAHLDVWETLGIGAPSRTPTMAGEIRFMG
ncbi:hypothetical protein R3P38DRAFT_895394 [Favolaschia claudopus]|uniref:Zn(2)-C6 fungal-type domain-containing protein n=1 Tax=Favolaschia claudopus TaxID=2862362 RepID=A0AAW0BSP0_9AGAR